MDLVYQYTLLVDGFGKSYLHCIQTRKLKMGFISIKPNPDSVLFKMVVTVSWTGLDPWQEIKLVKQVEYHNNLVEAAWPLGSAIEAVSSA